MSSTNPIPPDDAERPVVSITDLLNPAAPPDDAAAGLAAIRDDLARLPADAAATVANFADTADRHPRVAVIDDPHTMDEGTRAALAAGDPEPADLAMSCGDVIDRIARTR